MSYFILAFKLYLLNNINAYINIYYIIYIVIMQWNRYTKWKYADVIKIVSISNLKQTKMQLRKYILMQFIYFLCLVPTYILILRHCCSFYFFSRNHFLNNYILYLRCSVHFWLSAIYQCYNTIQVIIKNHSN